MHLNQAAESLIQLRLTLRREDAQLTLYVHHSLADGHHEFSLVEELLSYYTDLVCTGRVPAVTVQPAPDPLEVVLAQRGIQKQQRSGLERFMPAVFAYNLPPSRRTGSDVKPAVPLRVPMAGCQLSERETRDLIALVVPQKISLKTACCLRFCSWRSGDFAAVRISMVPSSIRSICGTSCCRPSCPRRLTCTNPLGVATYLAEIDRNTDAVEPRPGHRRDFSGGPVRRGDPAVAASLQPAIRRESTRLARCRHVDR